jgi:tRNA modification GTPase
MTTRVAQLTPRGRGAIASLLVVGTEAVDAVVPCFRPHARLDPARLPMGRIVSGRWTFPRVTATCAGAANADEPLGEELVVCRTGDEKWEVHCHGGQAAVAAIMGDLVRHGCIETAWEEIAGASGNSSIQRAAQQALARATTERTARILLDQYHGALTDELNRLAVELRNAQYSHARRRLERLLDLARVGRHLTDPWQVVLAGPPNVGKSSLINALVGYQRTVVFDTPGTTRDVVTVSTALDGWPVELSDTAGIRTTTDELESAGVDRARRQLEQSDLIIWVQDATQMDVDPLPAELAKRPSLRVFNQCDRLSPSDRAALRRRTQLGGGEHAPTVGGNHAPNDRPVVTSALQGEGLPELIAAIVRALVPEPPPQGGAVPFCRDQEAQLRQMLTALDRGDYTTACALMADGAGRFLVPLP